MPQVQRGSKRTHARHRRASYSMPAMGLTPSLWMHFSATVIYSVSPLSTISAPFLKLLGETTKQPVSVPRAWAGHLRFPCVSGNTLITTVELQERLPGARLNSSSQFSSIYLILTPGEELFSLRSFAPENCANIFHSIAGLVGRCHGYRVIRSSQ